MIIMSIILLLLIGKIILSRHSIYQTNSAIKNLVAIKWPKYTYKYKLIHGWYIYLGLSKSVSVLKWNLCSI